MSHRNPFEVHPHQERFRTGGAVGEAVHVLQAWRLTGPGIEDKIRFGVDGRDTLRREAERLNDRHRAAVRRGRQGD